MFYQNALREGFLILSNMTGGPSSGMYFFLIYDLGTGFVIVRPVLFKFQYDCFLSLVHLITEHLLVINNTGFYY